MKALCVRQPWAWAIIHGGKEVENRTRATHYRGALLIVASMRRHERQAEDDWHIVEHMMLTIGCRAPSLNEMTYGGVIGMVSLVDCFSPATAPDAHRNDPWFTGPWGWLLKDATAVPFIPCKGRLGLFDVSYP